MVGAFYSPFIWQITPMAAGLSFVQEVAITLASDHEGLQVAQWLNGYGIHAFVLRYRLGPRYHSSISRLDGQRAVRLARHHASDGVWTLSDWACWVFLPAVI